MVGRVHVSGIQSSQNPLKINIDSIRLYISQHQHARNRLDKWRLFFDAVATRYLVAAMIGQSFLATLSNRLDLNRWK